MNVAERMDTWYALAVIVFFWSVFFVGPIWHFGIQSCRMSSWWDDGYKQPKYFEIPPRYAKLLILRYSGYNTHISTNIPALCNQYVVNKYPTRLSVIGVADYCVTAILESWYGVRITAYFWFGQFESPMVPLSMALLAVHSLIFGAVNVWNRSRVKPDYEVISKKEMKKRRRNESGSAG